MRGNSSVGAEAISTYIPRMRDDAAAAAYVKDHAILTHAPHIRGDHPMLAGSMITRGFQLMPLA